MSNGREAAELITEARVHLDAGSKILADQNLSREAEMDDPYFKGVMEDAALNAQLATAHATLELAQQQRGANLLALYLASDDKLAEFEEHTGLDKHTIIHFIEGILDLREPEAQSGASALEGLLSFLTESTKPSKDAE